MPSSSKSTALSPFIKKSVAIVLIGNFLDFFDLMLATHLTLVLTKVFIPPHSSLTPLLTVFTFCSAFCIRPIAAIFWGYIGDTIGRVPVLISTTFLMSISCILIPNIPPFAEWGMLSAVLFLGLRLLQGFAAGGECIAADVFITETVPKPKVYFCSALVEATCSLGRLVACGVGAICISLSPENGWKIPFYIGSGVAVLGTVARKALKETPDFLKTLAHRAKKKGAGDLYAAINFKNRNIPALFALYLFPAVGFYFSLAYLPSVLESQFHLPTNQIMAQTTFVLFITMCAEICYGFLGLKYHPFQIIKFKLFALLCIIPIFMFTLDGFKSPLIVFIIQVLVVCLGQGLTPATPIINKSFPIFGRYTHLLLIWAISHSLMYLVTAFICEKITNFNILCLFLLISVVISLIGLYCFIPEEKMNKPKLDNLIKSLINDALIANSDNEKKDDQDGRFYINYINKWLGKVI